MGDAKAKFRARAAVVFERSDSQLEEALSTMLSEFSAAGRMGSGATAIAAVRIFQHHAETALDGVLGEAAKLIEHRGRGWNEAMAGISAALDAHLATAPDKLERATRLSGARESPAAMEALLRLLDKSGERLRRRVVDFRDGWTAPVPKQWKDRHPFFYALLLIALGAAVGRFV